MGVTGNGGTASGLPRLAPVRPGPLRLALVLLAVLAVLLGAVQVAVGAVAPTEFWIPVAFTIVYDIWAAAGIIAWWRRPASATGALLLLGALAVLVSGLGNLGLPVFTELSAVFATLILAVTVHLLHAFPSGRLRGRLSVATVAVGYGVTLVLQAPLYLLPPDQTGLLIAATWVQRVIGLGVMVVTAVVLIRRLRSSEPQNVGVVLPMYLYGILAVLLIPVSANVLQLFGGDYVVIGATQLVILAGLPVAFLLGVLLGGFPRTSEADALSAWIGTVASTRTTVAQALARSLGDDSLRVAYWSEDSGSFVDEHGAVIDRAAVGGTATDSDRVWQDVVVDSRLVGAISYDGRMIGDPETVRRAGRVLAIALDRERLTAALIASNEALLLSRLRLVETADRERGRIARDLHDGLQVQLVLLALEAQQIANADDASAGTASAATELRRRIDAAAADLRRLVHDVLPSGLVERGLTAAAEDLVDRLAIPASLESDVDDRALAPATARTAYLIVAEALTNAVKHADARSVSVGLTRHGDGLTVVVVDDGDGGARIDAGTGLKGLVDRVDALGGTLTLVSPIGEGTELRVELP
jgi:signal transduction histidine kinase